MNYEIIFTDTAESDLSDIALFIAEESKDKEVAKKFLGELISLQGTAWRVSFERIFAKRHCFAKYGLSFFRS